MKLHILAAALGVSALVCSCGRHAESGHSGHDHVHDAHLYYTTYTPENEIYLQAAPFVAGHEGGIHLYLSSLPDFRPVEGTTPAVSLSSGGSVAEGHVHPEEDGLYHVHITPAASGEGVLTVNGTTFPVTVYDDEHEAHEAAEAAMPHSANAVNFGKALQWKIDFATSTVVAGGARTVISAAGTVEPVPGSFKAVTAGTSGIVRLGWAGMAPGEEVRQGRTLFSIDTRSLAEGNLATELAAAQAEYDRAQAEYERFQAMYDQRLVTESELLRVKAEAISAAGRYHSLNANYSGGSQNITSPISGYIMSVDVADGEAVEAGRTLGTVASTDRVQIVAKVPSRYRPELSHIADATFLADDGKAFTLAQLDGNVVAYGRGSNSPQGLIPVTFSIRDNGNFVPGSTLRVRISCAAEGTAITVPDVAILEETGNYYVYVQLTPELFDKRQITPGASDGVNTVVLDGLAAGERVVSRGAVALRLAQSAGTIDPHAGHVH